MKTSLLFYLMALWKSGSCEKKENQNEETRDFLSEWSSKQDKCITY